MSQTDNQVADINKNFDELYGWKTDSSKYLLDTNKGLSEDVIRAISTKKDEPKWMLDFRLGALAKFNAMPDPTWIDSSIFEGINYADLYLYASASDKQYNNWDDVPEDIKDTFDRLGIPEAERKFLAGVSAQFESEVVYHSIQEDLEKKGVIFLDIDSALKKHEDLFRKYFATIVPPDDNKFAALNSAAWSGGSFIYVPEGVKVDIPLQAYFRINAEAMGQFERTMIIADKGASVHYIEGCTAPTYTKDSFHTGVIELFAMEDAYLRYTTIQNWSTNVYNLVTQRASAKKNATVEWMDGNIGSKTTMKYPSVLLEEPGASGRIMSIGYASKGQRQDAGGKMIHMAPHTTSSITSKSISQDGGRASYRGKIEVKKGASHIKSDVECDALLLDDYSESDTYPTIEVRERKDVNIAHEATVGKVSDEAIFYLMSRGIPENDAMMMVVNGFLEEFTKELPMEYAVELNRLIQLEMEGSIG
ncbi:Fe-S cluster assembly protein SufB [Spirochaeta cellobiosiphila]|uniref:Fe-S cluster assembly protein SufB n=1 Tax=Spirochaeta cellobiosiphila TaxID=504483 RepID=UPI00041ECC0B|nr:Fe-S cluster assembly protein SufB [Spirochaeta cellobiosiphila]